MWPFIFLLNGRSITAEECAIINVKRPCRNTLTHMPVCSSLFEMCKYKLVLNVSQKHLISHDQYIYVIFKHGCMRTSLLYLL